MFALWKANFIIKTKLREKFTPFGYLHYSIFYWLSSRTVFINTLILYINKRVIFIHRKIGDKLYDFTSLVRHDSNYVGHDYQETMYYANICHRLVADGDATNCPAGAAACMKRKEGEGSKWVGMA